MDEHVWRLVTEAAKKIDLKNVIEKRFIAQDYPFNGQFSLVMTPVA